MKPRRAQERHIHTGDMAQHRMRNYAYGDRLVGVPACGPAVTYVGPVLAAEKYQVYRCATSTTAGPAPVYGGGNAKTLYHSDLRERWLYPVAKRGGDYFEPFRLRWRFTCLNLASQSWPTGGFPSQNTSYSTATFFAGLWDNTFAPDTGTDHSSHDVLMSSNGTNVDGMGIWHWEPVQAAGLGTPMSATFGPATPGRYVAIGPQAFIGGTGAEGSGAWPRELTFSWRCNPLPHMPPGDMGTHQTTASWEDGATMMRRDLGITWSPGDMITWEVDWLDYNDDVTMRVSVEDGTPVEFTFPKEKMPWWPYDASPDLTIEAGSTAWYDLWESPTVVNYLAAAGTKSLTLSGRPTFGGTETLTRSADTTGGGITDPIDDTYGGQMTVGLYSSDYPWCFDREVTGPDQVLYSNSGSASASHTSSNSTASLTPSGTNLNGWGFFWACYADTAGGASSIPADADDSWVLQPLNATFEALNDTPFFPIVPTLYAQGADDGGSLTLVNCGLVVL